MGGVCGRGGGRGIGGQSKKDVQTLGRAYNDRGGVTAGFKLNMLRRINRELDADCEVEAFEHKAIYNEDFGRVEMHLVSLSDQDVRVAGEHTFRLEEGETIRTECSYKYHVEEFADLANAAEFEVEEVWTDADQLFSVQYLGAV